MGEKAFCSPHPTYALLQKTYTNGRLIKNLRVTDVVILVYTSHKRTRTIRATPAWAKMPYTVLNFLL